MAQQLLNLGSFPEDHTGDTLRAGGGKINANFAEIYAAIINGGGGCKTAQIGFPATQVSSSDPNTLDDYEEGTFTPTFTASTPPTGVAYATQIGKYTKIGRKVFFSIYVALSSKGSGGANFITINGLPFSALNDSSFPSLAIECENVALGAGLSCFGARLGNGSASVFPQQCGSAVAVASTTWAQCVDTSKFYIAGAYAI